jgi:hypothetical protein
MEERLKDYQIKTPNDWWKMLGLDATE